jgi:hypothetical protein
MTNTTATFSKLNNGSWGIQGTNLVSGQTVTVVKRNGETKQEVVDQIVAPKDTPDYVIKKGYVQATIKVVTAEVTVKARDKVTEIGFYLHGGVAYKVVKSGAGRLYAKKVTKSGFDYDEGAIFKLSASELMTAEEVRVYSRSCGICANCSVSLEDPISVEIGLGTSCGPSILGSDAYKAARKAAKLVPWVIEALAKIKAEKAAEKALIAGRTAEQIAFEEMIESEIEAERRSVEAGMF